jgi:hypothetical protein
MQGPKFPWFHEKEAVQKNEGTILEFYFRSSDIL